MWMLGSEAQELRTGVTRSSKYGDTRFFHLDSIQKLAYLSRAIRLRAESASTGRHDRLDGAGTGCLNIGLSERCVVPTNRDRERQALFWSSIICDEDIETARFRLEWSQPFEDGSLHSGGGDLPINNEHEVEARSGSAKTVRTAQSIAPLMPGR